jgi:hypothetical protein
MNYGKYKVSSALRNEAARFQPNEKSLVRLIRPARRSRLVSVFRAFLDFDFTSSIHLFFTLHQHAAALARSALKGKAKALLIFLSCQKARYLSAKKHFAFIFVSPDRLLFANSPRRRFS